MPNGIIEILDERGGTITGDVVIQNEGKTRHKLNIVNTDVGRQGRIDLDENGAFTLKNIDDDTGNVVQLAIATDAVGTAHSLYLHRMIDGDLSSYLVYHTGNKPTTTDISAVNKNGDTMYGNLRVETPLPDIVLKNTNTGRASFVRAGTYSAQVLCFDDETDENNYRRFVLYSPEGHRLTDALEFHDVVDGQVNIYQVYGTHNKPTPAAIGAAPEYGFGTNKLTPGTSPLASGHLYFVYK